MVQVIPPDQEIENVWFRWNVRSNEYELDEAKNRYLQRKKVSRTNRNYTKAIAGIILSDPQAISGLIEGTFGVNEGNYDRLFRETSKMSDAEVILGIAVLSVTVAASAFAGRVAQLKNKNELPSIKEIKNSPKFKEIFPKNDVNLDAGILTYKTRYENASNFTRAKMNSRAVDYQASRLRTKYNKAVSDKDPTAIEKAQKEIDEFGNGNYSTAKRELKEQELKNERMERLENEAITAGERESILQTLREETGNDTPKSDWMALYRLRFKKNPTRDELYEFTRDELKTQADTGNAPSIIGEWYEQYGGGNEQGISTDLQELGRRVMSMLDGGDGVLDEPSGQFLMENFSRSESEALQTAYNNPSIWNKIKADYKKYVAGTAALGALGGGAGAIASQDTEESKVEGQEPLEKIIEEEEKKDEDELDLVESTDRPEEFIKKGEEEVVVKPDGSIDIIDEEEGLIDAEKELDVDPNEKEKGIDRLVPSGEPEPDLPEKDKPDLPSLPDLPKEPPPAPPPPPTPSITEEVDNLLEDSEEETIRDDIEFKNIDELLRLSFQSTQDVYENTIIDKRGEYYRIDGYSIPILFNKQGNKLFIAFRGTDSLANIITDLYTTNPFTLGENKLDYYPFFRERINEKKDIGFHAGFIQALVYPPSKHKRLGQKIESDYTPLYEVVRNNIDKFIGEVTDLIFTGHSLGGAIAGICYYLYMNDSYRSEDKILNSVRAVTYGSPRFVLDGGQDVYNRTCPNLIRCFNSQDIITYVPFYRSITGINILDGFIHVGKAFCLDSPLARNDINRLLVEFMEKPEPVNIAIRGNTSNQGTKNIELIKTKEYQINIIKGLLESLAYCEVKEQVSEQDIYNMEAKMLQDLRSNIPIDTSFKEIGLENYIKSIRVEDTQKEFYFGSLFGYILGSSKISTSAHLLKTYKENIDTVITIEIESKLDVLENKGNLEDAEMKEVKKVIKENRLKQTIKERIIRKETRIPILGFIKDFEGVQLIEIKNNTIY